jgi:hypothetical protein
MLGNKIVIGALATIISFAGLVAADVLALTPSDFDKVFSFLLSFIISRARYSPTTSRK